MVLGGCLAPAAREEWERSLEAYWRGHDQGNEQLKNDAVRWLRARRDINKDPIFGAVAAMYSATFARNSFAADSSSGGTSSSSILAASARCMRSTRSMCSAFSVYPANGPIRAAVRADVEADVGADLRRDLPRGERLSDEVYGVGLGRGPG